MNLDDHGHYHFGTILRKIRRELNMTQEHLGGLVNVNQSQVAQWERLRSGPKFETVLSLCAAMGVPVTRFAEHTK